MEIISDSSEQKLLKESNYKAMLTKTFGRNIADVLPCYQGYQNPCILSQFSYS